eukprot:g3006.t1
MERVALRELALQQAAAEAASAAAEAAAVATNIAHSAATHACRASKSAEAAVADLHDRLKQEAAVRAAAAAAAAKAAAAALAGSAAVLPLVAEADAVVAELVSRHEEEQRLKMALKHAVTVAKVAAAAASGSAIQARRAIKCGAATRLQCALRRARTTSLLEKLASVELMAEQFESFVRSTGADVQGSDSSIPHSFADADARAGASDLNRHTSQPQPARERTSSWGGRVRVSGLLAGARNILSAGRRKQGQDGEKEQCGDDGGDGEDGEDEQGLAMEAPIQQLCRRVAELRVWMHELAVECDSTAAQKRSAADLVTKMELVVGDFEQRLTQLLRNAEEAATAAARAARQSAACATAQVISALDAIHEATGRLQREQREQEAAVRAAAAAAAAKAAAAALAGSAAVLPLVAEADAVVAELVSRHEEEQRLKMALKHAVTVAKVAAAAASGSAMQAKRAAKDAAKHDAAQRKSRSDTEAAKRIQSAIRQLIARSTVAALRQKQVDDAAARLQSAVRMRIAQRFTLYRMRGLLAGARKAAQAGANVARNKAAVAGASVARNMSTRRKHSNNSAAAAAAATEPEFAYGADLLHWGDESNDGDEASETQSAGVQAAEVNHSQKAQSASVEAEAETPMQQVCRLVVEIRLRLRELSITSGETVLKTVANAPDMVTKMEVLVDDFERRLIGLLGLLGGSQAAATVASSAARNAAASAVQQASDAEVAVQKLVQRLNRERFEQRTITEANSKEALVTFDAAEEVETGAGVRCEMGEDLLGLSFSDPHQSEQAKAAQQAPTVACGDLLGGMGVEVEAEAGAEAEAEAEAEAGAKCEDQNVDAAKSEGQNTGLSLVGKRVRVGMDEMPVEDYMPGMIDAFDETDGYHVVYDDGDAGWEADLSTIIFDDAEGDHCEVQGHAPVQEAEQANLKPHRESGEDRVKPEAEAGAKCEDQNVDAAKSEGQNTGLSLVGKRVRVGMDEMPVEDYMPGMIDAFDETDGYHVVYDDGDAGWEADLSTIIFDDAEGDHCEVQGHAPVQEAEQAKLQARREVEQETARREGELAAAAARNAALAALHASTHAQACASAAEEHVSAAQKAAAARWKARREQQQREKQAAADASAAAALAAVSAASESAALCATTLQLVRTAKREAEEKAKQEAKAEAKRKADEKAKREAELAAAAARNAALAALHASTHAQACASAAEEHVSAAQKAAAARWKA